jgi:hypothetical protein
MKRPLTFAPIFGGVIFGTATLANSATSYAQSATAQPATTVQPKATAQPTPQPTTPTTQPAQAQPAQAQVSPTEATPSSAPASETPPPVVTATPLVAPATAEPAPYGQTEWTETQTTASPETLPPATVVHDDGRESGFFIGATWDMNLPVGSSTEFASTFGVQGVGVQARYQGLGRIGLGGVVAWEAWSQKSDQTTVSGNATLGGTQARTIWVNPVYARAQFALFDIRSPSSHKTPVPYAALNFGGAHATRRVDVGISRLTEDSWHWAFAPEIGVEIPVSRLVVLAGARFNYLFASGEGPEQLYFSFNIGLGAF